MDKKNISGLSVLQFQGWLWTAASSRDVTNIIPTEGRTEHFLPFAPKLQCSSSEILYIGADSTKILPSIEGERVLDSPLDSLWNNSVNVIIFQRREGHTE